jgi:hypothetical protein
MLMKMGAQYSRQMERHEALVVNHNARYELRLLPALALEQQPLGAMGRVEEHRF